MSKTNKHKVTGGDLTFVSARIPAKDYRNLLKVSKANGRTTSEEIRARMLRETRRIFVPQV